MGLFAGLWLIVLGVLAIPSLIIAKRPEAKDLIAKISPYQGWIGAISAFWGVWVIISSILDLGGLTIYPIWWATYLADGVVQLALGLLLGVGVLKTFIKAEAAHEKLDQAINKLSPYQGTLGLVAIGLGIWVIVANILFM